MDLKSVKQRFGIVGNSTKLNHAIETAIKVAPTEMSVLIDGESGVGKEHFSKLIHQLSLRKHNKFIAINCGAIPQGTIDSELFGHEKGSFTGALGTRKGYFESVNEGTIFLDEIGELPMGTQSRLLRVLESGEFIKVGSSIVQKTNVRIIAASNKNLLGLAGKNKFREDLYYRLATVPIRVPNLRERGDDIMWLIHFFSGQFSEKYHTTLLDFTDDAKQLLLNYSWPGNVRQLKNITEQLSVLENNEVPLTAQTVSQYLPASQSFLPTTYELEKLSGSKYDKLSERDIFYKVLIDLKKDVNDLKKVVFDISQGKPSQYNQPAVNNFDEFKSEKDTPAYVEIKQPKVPVVEIKKTDTYDNNANFEETEHIHVEENLSLEVKEKELIIKALDRHNQRRRKAAKDLGISERTLYRKIKQYELEEE